MRVKRFRDDDLERRLRRGRPEPREDFVYSLAERVRSDRRRSRRRAFRIAFVGALTVAMLAALASVGGLGYAAGSAKSAWHGLSHKATHKATNQGRARVTRTPAAFEYGRKVLVCHNGHTIFISKNAVPAHLRHGDALGPCP
jgi:hypothetical protein